VNETETSKIFFILPQIEKISIHPQRLFSDFQVEKPKNLKEKARTPYFGLKFFRNTKTSPKSRRILHGRS